MQDESDRIIREIYLGWKAGRQPEQLHPDEESFVCFIEGKLPPEDERKIANHVLSCAGCGKIVRAHLVTQPPAEDAPPALIEKTRSLLARHLGLYVMELVLAVRNSFLEVIETSGDVRVGQELVPAAVLRSREVRQFKDEVTVLKDFKDLRVELLVEKKGGGFTATVIVKDAETQKPRSDLRISLLKDGLELESYLAEAGKVVFEHVSPGKTGIDISAPNEKRAALLLEIRA